MLPPLAQPERDQALSEGYLGITLICLIGLLMIVLLLLLFLSRRWARRHLTQIEEAKAERRAERSADRVDAWRAGADRYVDHDKLPDDDDDMDPGRAGDAQGMDDEDDEDASPDVPPPGWHEPGPEDDDPYGLFDDKPYRDADDDDEADDEDDDWGDEDDDEDDDASDEEKGRR